MYEISRICHRTPFPMGSPCCSEPAVGQGQAEAAPTVGIPGQIRSLRSICPAPRGVWACHTSCMARHHMVCHTGCIACHTGCMARHHPVWAVWRAISPYGTPYGLYGVPYGMPYAVWRAITRGRAMGSRPPPLPDGEFQKAEAAAARPLGGAPTRSDGVAVRLPQLRGSGGTVPPAGY
eukprot:gene18986-biopygen16016